MAVEITVRGKYYVPSTIAGKKEVRDYTVKLPYPVSVDPEVPEEVSEAMFYIKRFLLEGLVKDTDPESFYGINTSACHHVKDLTDEQIKKYIDSGDLVAVDVDSLTASDINGMKKTSDFIKVLILCDTDAEHLKDYNDMTDLVARERTMWLGSSVESKRNRLKWILGIEEKVEVKRGKKARKKSKLLDAAGVESTEKPKRAPRKKSAPTVAVSVDV